MATYVYDHDLGIMVDKATREPMNAEPLSGPFPTPLVVSDIQPYISPVSGEVIGGKRAKRADLDKHNAYDGADFPTTTGGKFRSRSFAKKFGLEHLAREDAVD
jgi:hypothetical protein